MARVNVYIDGLNLYYGLIRKRNPDLKWIDLRATAEGLFPDDDVGRVRYFTARLSGRAGDPTAPERQDRYLRALESHGGVDIHRGHFIVGEETFYLSDDSGNKARVWNIVEKCSDVNMATHILLDAIAGECDLVTMITNDADPRVLVQVLQEPPFNLPVWIFNPCKDKNNHLRPTEHRNLRRGDLVRLPNVVRTARGSEIHPPTAWRP